MKKYGLLGVAFAFMFSLAVSAQDQTPPSSGNNGSKPEMRQGNRQQMTPEMRAERLAKQVEMTDAQKAQVKAMYEKQDADRQKNQGNVEKTREEMKAQYDAERKATDEELSRIIGKEKFDKLEAARAEKMKEMKDKRERPKSADGVR